ENAATRERDQILNFGLNFGLLGAAKDIVRLAAEREKPDAERESGYQARDEARLEAGLRQLEKRMDPGVDRILMRYWLQRHAALPAAQRLPEIDAWFGAEPSPEALEAKLDALYGATTLADTEARLRWFRADRID